MKINRCCLFFAAMCLVALGAVFPVLAFAGVPAGWHGIDPGFRVQVLLSHGATMWAAGSDETIAMSADGGEHWQARHRDPGGALLLSFRFVNDKFGYAAGTGGQVLFTEDGGETWTAQKLTQETILQAAFGDRLHGVVRTAGALLSTTDGGESWRPVRPESDPDWWKRFPVTFGMVALDKNWMTVRVSQTLASAWAGEFLWSSDGGETWNTSSIDGTRIYDLFVEKGAIWAAGYEKSTPMSFREMAGAKWEHVPVNYEACHWPGCGGYTPQGYFAGKDFVLFTDDGKETMARFPIRDVLSGQWARSDEKLCVVSHEAIECATLQPVKQVEMDRDMPSWESSGFAGIGRIPRSTPQCLRCDLQPVFHSASDPTGPMDAQVTLTIDPAGRVTDAKVDASVPSDVAAWLIQQTKLWWFEPHGKSGESDAVELKLHARVMVGNQSPIRAVVGKPRAEVK